MKQFKTVYLLSLLVLSTNSTLCFASESDLRTDLRRGIDLLYQNQSSKDTCTNLEICPGTIDKDKLVDRAISFKQNYDQIIANYKVKDLIWKKPKDTRALFTEFQFSSPIQNADSPANTVYGYVYTPDMPAGCNVKFPATMLVHHVANDISDERLFAELAAKMSKGIVMVIYLPEYGPRKKDPQAPPFNADIQVFKKSLLQSLVDIRIAGQILKSLDHVDQNRIQVGGLSLGALLTAISAGIDPFFNEYLIGLGGGDLAKVMSVNKEKTITVIKEALAQVNWDEDMARSELSDLDALTWAYTVRNKKITVLSAIDDELVDQTQSVKKLVSAYSENGNKVKFYQHKGKHVPSTRDMSTVDVLKAYAKVVYRVINFFGNIKSAEVDQCRTTDH